MERGEGLLPVFRLAKAVRSIAAEETQITQAAIAFAAINRRLRFVNGNELRADTRCIGEAVRELGEEGQLGEGWASFNEPGVRDTVADAAFYRAMASVCLVLSGDLPDPTGGATRFHRHDELPEWAKRREPVALIGPWFFYIA